MPLEADTAPASTCSALAAESINRTSFSVLM